MKIKIVSDGTPRNTTVVDAVTGEMLEGIQSIRWELAVNNPLATAIITFIKIPVELEARLGEIKESGESL